MGCHGAKNPKGKLDMTRYESLRKGGTKNDPISAGKPEDSYLMNKVEGTNDCSGFTCMGADKCGIQMPDPQSPIEKSSMELIRAWIKKGMAM
jgi:hypothetical protein